LIWIKVPIAFRLLDYEPRLAARDAVVFLPSDLGHQKVWWPFSFQKRVYSLQLNMRCRSKLSVSTFHVSVMAITRLGLYKGIERVTVRGRSQASKGEAVTAEDRKLCHVTRVGDIAPQEGLCPCAMNTQIKTRQGDRFAQTALRSCGSFE